MHNEPAEGGALCFWGFLVQIVDGGGRVHRGLVSPIIATDGVKHGNSRVDLNLGLAFFPPVYMRRQQLEGHHRPWPPRHFLPPLNVSNRATE